MNHKKISALLLALTLALLPVALSGCESIQDSPAPSSQVEAEPTEAPTPEPTAVPTPEATAEPTPEATEEPDTQSSFEELFAANPIDRQLMDALDIASTNRAIYDAFHTSEENWRKIVEGIYPLALDCLTGADRDQLQADHEAWQAEMTEKLPGIEEECGEDEDGRIEASSKISDLYRAQAMALCQVYYEGNGELPDFESILSTAPMG